jgi:Entner-Doudoroff aldolase
MNIFEIIKQTKIIPVVKIDDAGATEPLVSAIIGGGINVAEITYRTNAAREAIEIAAKAFPDAAVGAGTVLTLGQAEEAFDSGAKFIVSPGFSEDLGAFCIEKKIPYFGGAVTPTEIMKALAMGFDTVKYFPASVFGGIAGMKALSGPFPSLKFIPTGGINLQNLREYLSFDKIIACGGSWMVKDELIKAGDFKKIEALCRESLEETRK